VLTTFLSSILGVDSETAEAEACRMEHVLSSDTMERLSAFVENSKTQP
jgi:Mn-dependent DtxR family transcriptional regulator